MIVGGFVVFAAIGLSSTLKLPDYIKPCSLKDPKINQCIKDHANEAIPTIVKGDKKYKVISFSPFKSPEILLEAGQNLKIKLIDANVDHLGELRIQDVQLDYEKKHLKMSSRADILTLESKYDIKGQILVLPITGNGNVNASLNNGLYTYEIDFEEIDIKGEKHMNLVKSMVDYKVQRAYFHFDNLFNGDKALGDQMNKFIDENWEVVSDEIKPALSETIRSVLDNVIQAYFKAVPLKDFFN